MKICYTFFIIGDDMKNRNGFTLVELLAVVGILALLLIISVPKINKYIIDKKNDNFKTSARNICRQIEYDNLEYVNFTSISLSELNLSNLPSEKYDLEKSIAYVQDKEIYLNLVGKGVFEGMYLCGMQRTSSDIEVQYTECN